MELSRPVSRYTYKGLFRFRQPLVRFWKNVLIRFIKGRRPTMNVDKTFPKSSVLVYIRRKLDEHIHCLLFLDYARHVINCLKHLLP